MPAPQISIDYEHQKVHEGRHYTANYLEKAVANNGFIRLRFTTGARAVHIIFEIDAEGKAYWQTYNGTTYTIDGTLPDGVKLTFFNRFIENDGTTTIVRYNPTVNVIGTLRGNRVLWGGLGPQSTGGSSQSRIESIIPPMVMQNVSGNAKDMAVVAD
jgi:hypothetical protein